MDEPLGRQHPTIRRLRALRRDAERRRAEGVLLAEGLHLARAALEAGAEIELALVAPRLGACAEGRDLLAALRRAAPCATTSDAVLDALQDARSPQPVTLLVRRPRWPVEAGLAAGREPAPLVVIADGLQDPGNLGALVRTADAAGATTLRVCGSAADPFHPRAVRATAGSILRLPVLVHEPAALRELLRGAGCRILAVVPDGGTDYTAAALAGPVAVVLGGEGRGVSDGWVGAADGTVRIPMRPGVESLSVGAAGAVVLYEAARQRAGPARRPDP